MWSAEPFDFALCIETYVGALVVANERLRSSFWDLISVAYQSDAFINVTKVLPHTYNRL